MRARTTWNMQDLLSRTATTSPTAATNRTADPYAMNQDHIRQQPGADKYLTGDPSAFAEDITTPNNWQVEYSGGAVKRNEIGMPEDRPETFNHPEKTASSNPDHLLKKADMTVRIARRMLGANAPEVAVEEQAASLMHLPDQEVINTYNRLAGEMPPALKEHMEQKQQQAGKQEESAEQVQEQAKQAAIRGDKVAFDAAMSKLISLRMANGQQQGQPMQQQGQAQQQQAQGQQPQQAPAQQQAGQQQQGQAQQQSAWYDSKGQRPGHQGPDTGPYAGQQQQAQGQPMMQPAQGQQQMPPAQAGQQQFPGGQWGDGGHQQQAQGQQAPAQGVEAQVQQMIEQAAQQMQGAKMANDPQQPPAQQQQQAGQQQQAQGQQPMQQQGAGYQQQAQGQQPQQAPAQQQAQVQQQGGQQQQAQGQQPMQQQAQGLTNPNQGVSPNYAGQQQMQANVRLSDDQLLDQMLMGPGAGAAPAPGGVAEMDIQMEAPSMDIGEVAFQPGEDDMLRQLFSNDEAMAAQQAQAAQEQQGQQQGQQVQAANIRTAALRTVGTRPTAGVARIGGAGAPPTRGAEVDKLTSLWQSAPDVREVFGLKTT